MNEARRAYDLMRAYVNREFERIKKIDLMDAVRELDEATRGPSERSGGAAMPEPAPEKLVLEVKEGQDLEATAREILGVGKRADFDTIRRAYEKLSRRSQPENFEPGSEESAQASDLLRKVTWAYTYLTKDVPASEKRFRSLEIE